MECLTLQDVPSYHHRTAMSFHERSPSRHHAKLHETSERMKVGTVVNPNKKPFSSSLSPTPSPSAPPRRPRRRESRHSPYPVARTCRSASPRSPPAGDAPPPPQPLTGDGRREDALSTQSGIFALLEADQKRRKEAQRRLDEDEELQHERIERRFEEASQTPPLLSRPAHDPRSALPRPEMLISLPLRPQNTERLPSFQELARLADKTNEEHNSTDNGIGFWQTSSARTSRQSSTERPVFNDPFRGPQPTSPLRASNQHIHAPLSADNYTTRSEARNSFLSTRPSPPLDYCRSVRAEYEPRAPSLPALFTPSRTVSHDSGPPATRPQYHLPPTYSQPPHLPISPPEARRASEVPFGHQGYGAAYNRDQYRQRPSWAPEASGHPRHYGRHDSTIYSGPEQHWNYGYPPGYGYGMDGVHHDGIGRKRRGNLPKEATAVLKKWFQDHCESPYPTDEEKSHLAIETGLTSAQISNWFINARRRTPGREARETARQNRANQQLGQGQQQARGQDMAGERARGAQTSQSTASLQQPHYHQLQPQQQLEQQEHRQHQHSEHHRRHQDLNQDDMKDHRMRDA